jgi:hypothetical protein
MAIEAALELMQKGGLPDPRRTDYEAVEAALGIALERFELGLAIDEQARVKRRGKEGSSG